MALDDRDYMRRRTNRPAGWREAVYNPRAFRSLGGTASAGRPDPAARSGGRQAGLPGWMWVFVAAVVIVIVSALHARSQRSTQASPPPPAPTAPHVAAVPKTAQPAPARQPPAHADPRPAPPTGSAVPPPAVPQDPYSTVYLCRTWQGAQFWSRQPCQLHQATLLRLHRVSSHLTWDQQVAVAQEEARIAARLLPQ